MNQYLVLLKKELKLKYPPYHYKHIEVFTAYWNLVETIKKEYES